MDPIRQEKSKLAVIFPGIGYHRDKPLLYYARALTANLGYDVIHIEYHDMPQKIRGNAEMMKQAAELAYAQTSEQLDPLRFDDYEDIIFLGKSIGTVALAKYIAEHRIRARQVWYTPVEATFSFDSENVIAFIGDADPWSSIDAVRHLAEERHIALHLYPGCNHSLECEDVDQNLANLRDVMQKTRAFLV